MLSGWGVRCVRCALTVHKGDEEYIERQGEEGVDLGRTIPMATPTPHLAQKQGI